MTVAYDAWGHATTAGARRRRARERRNEGGSFFPSQVCPPAPAEAGKGE
jgi:hypothetical protein